MAATAFRCDSTDRARLDAATREQIIAALFALLDARGPDKTICPSEVARYMAADEPADESEDQAWRAWMPAVRLVATELVDEKRVVATQRGAAVDIAEARGPIRLGRPRDA